MSLGFLTESALLPSKAKEIKVDSKSILDLKAVVFQKEQERKERRRRLAEEVGEDDDDRAGGSSRRRKRSRGNDAEHEDGYGSGGDAVSKSVYARLKAQKRKEREPKRNRGVESRSRRDAEQRELDVDNADDDEALKRKSREMLERKAKLYEQMMQGRRDTVPSAAVKECLVDFDEKRRATGAAAVVYEAGNNTEAERIEITDEFGRTRLVERGSEAHLEFARSQQQPQSLYYEDKRQQHGEREEKDIASVKPSGSYVVSQWEKTLNRTEKQYLEQVHAGVELTKQSVAAMDKQSRKQLRLEKLRRQQQQKAPVEPQTNETEVPADPRQAQEAEHKATAFLSQFTSLL